ncbi:hypothetical protein BGX31_006873 [Mortierella sp. GBA43]|nr:hypothetical protein BGX31_006873 [Mortierella sp. GBA43]
MPFVETLESYSRALYLPLRGYVRRPFQVVAELIREYVPGGLWDARKTVEHTVLGSSRLFDHTATNNMSTNASGTGGASQKSGSMIASGASMSNNKATLATAQIQPSTIVMNRINAIVAPRNPHPLKLSVRFALKLPAFYLLMKSALVTSALLIQTHSAIPMAWISDLKTPYSESQALWLSFIAMGVSCTTDSFVSNLNSNGPSEQTINMLEWAFLFHSTPFGRDVLVISVIEVCQQLTLQFLSLTTRGRNLRLIATTFWGILDLAYFTYAIYHGSSTYPSLQVLTRLPEVVVILIVLISLILHTLTYIVTGGNIRRQMFEPRAMPTMDEEYGVAVFKLGRACMEATRGVNFKNEVDAVVLPLGTILDDDESTGSRSPTRSTMKNSSQHLSLQPGPSRSVTTSASRHNGISNSGFSNEMIDIVETPAQRQQPSRRRDRINVMKAFYQSSAGLIKEVANSVYDKVVPRRFRRAPTETQDSEEEEYLQFRTNLVNALELARQARELEIQSLGTHYGTAEALDEDDEEELYNIFLSRELTASDDEDELQDVDFKLQDNIDEDEDDAFESEDENEELAESEQETTLKETGSYGIQNRRSGHRDSDTESLAEINSDTTQYGSMWSSLESFQDFFLDTSFMSIFLSGRLQNTPLTRLQHRLTMSGAREFPQGEIERGSGGESSRTTPSGSRWISRTKRKTSDEVDSRALIAVLNKYRKSFGDQQTSCTGSADSSSNMPPPPPLARFLDEDGVSSNVRVVEVMSKGSPESISLELYDLNLNDCLRTISRTVGMD